MFIGVVGKPSVGKSTFFKAATLANVEIAPYPFTTIKPNHAIGFVKVKDVALEFGKHSNPRTGYCLGDYRFVPIDLMDVAGLVPGAHNGLGMGNQFLDDLRQADVLIHVIDISGSVNEKGEAVEPGSYDPVNDVLFLEEELDFWYLGILKKGWDKFARTVIQEKKSVVPALAKQLSGLKVTELMIDAGLKKLSLDPFKPTLWQEPDLHGLARFLREHTKPMVIAANKIDVSTGKMNFTCIQEKFPHYLIIPCSAESELALREASRHNLIEYIPGEKVFTVKDSQKLSEQQLRALSFIQHNILQVYESTGVQEVINTAVFTLLKYIPIFPGGVNKLEDKDGNVLPDCFLMPGQTTALDFAYKLHTDFGKHFICAKDCKTKMTVGKEHRLKYSDVVEIVSGK